MNKLNANPGVRGDEQLSALARVLQPPVGEAFKDHYVLEFLGLPEPHSENDLKRAMMRPMKTFVLELGKDFLFVSKELPDYPA
jgi:predicted nuclease of restriction endonuclease-like (RecB) superfamily